MSLRAESALVLYGNSWLLLLSLLWPTRIFGFRSVRCFRGRSRDTAGCRLITDHAVGDKLAVRLLGHDHVHHRLSAEFESDSSIGALYGGQIGSRRGGWCRANERSDFGGTGLADFPCGRVDEDKDPT